MSDVRWTGETAELVADAIADADSLTGTIGPAVTALLAALADAGLLLPPGGETREVFEVRTRGCRWPGFDTEAAAWAQFAKVKAWPDKPAVKLCRRAITEWPDDSAYYGPLTEVQPWREVDGAPP